MHMDNAAHKDMHLHVIQNNLNLKEIPEINCISSMHYLAIRLLDLRFQA